MQVEWVHFTPWSSLAGGLLIGAGIALFTLLVGRVAGISGIVGGLLRPQPGETGWRLAFLAGLLGAPLAWRLFASLPVLFVGAMVAGMALFELLERRR